MSSDLVDSADAKTYAEYFATSRMVGVRYLAFRDLPRLIEKHVRGRKTLDYGCGAAISTTFLKSQRLQVEGVDVRPEMVAKARERDPDGVYAVIASGDVPKPAASYDFVFACWVLIEVPAKAELARICREVERLLKADGCFMIVANYEKSYNVDWSTVNSQFEQNKTLRSGAPVKMILKDVNMLMHQYFWCENDYREACRAAGMDIVESHYPLGTDEDGFEWTREKETAPLVVYVVKKMRV